MAENEKSIFIVRCYKLDLKSEENRIVRDRTWGFFHEETNAVKCIEENWTDIFENNYYNFAVVIEMKQGVCVRPEKVTWFKATYKSGQNSPIIKKVTIDPINDNMPGLGKFFISW